MSLLVIGTVAFDSVRTPFGHRDEVLGGSATYFSVAASFFSPVKMVAVVGKDFPGDIVDKLSGRGIDTSGLIRAAGETFRWSGEYGYDFNDAKTLKTELNVLEDFQPDLPAAHRESRYVFLANIDPVIQKSVHAQVQNPELTAADTMNFWIEGKREDLMETLSGIDLLVINDAEARMLAREASLPRAARKIRDMGPRSVIVKRGEYGVALFTETDTFAAPAFPLEEVVDPTGAGDSFAGGMMGYLARIGRVDPETLRQAIICGSVMASFNVEDFSMERMFRLTHDDIKARFREFKALTHFEPIEVGE